LAQLATIMLEQTDFVPATRMMYSSGFQVMDNGKLFLDLHALVMGAALDICLAKVQPQLQQAARQWRDNLVENLQQAQEEIIDAAGSQKDSGQVPTAKERQETEAIRETVKKRLLLLANTVPMAPCDPPQSPSVAGHKSKI
jgi:hypothetical protein